MRLVCARIRGGMRECAIGAREQGGVSLRVAGRELGVVGGGLRSISGLRHDSRETAPHSGQRVGVARRSRRS